MNLLSLIFPETVFKTTSKYSGEIKVIDHVFERRMSIGGLTQSGGILYGMWEKALDEVEKEKASSILILGLGAGTVAEIASRVFPNAKITGVEIDPVIIEIGKEYFQLKKLQKLNIVVGDAIPFVKKEKTKKYDLILVDLYTGYVIEKRLLEDNFLQKINTILSNNGIVIYNVLTIQKTHFEASKFLDKIRLIFQYKFNRKIVTNTFMYAGKCK